MAKITNNLGLPEALVEAVRRDPYTKGDADYSVTTLLSPPRQRALMALHEDELEEDASDRIYSLLGQALHTILERANRTGIAERRLFATIGGKRISGGMDLVHGDAKLTDYKTTTAWKFKDGTVPQEYEQQLNCYAEILRQNGEEVKELEIVAILRDWSKLEAMRNDGYPRSQVIIRKVRMWASDYAKEFMLMRVTLHEAAKTKLPECTKEERWAEDDIYAVHKEGKKNAEKLFRVSDLGDRAEPTAELFAKHAKGLTVVKRAGESRRCKAYCSVSTYCDQYKKENSLNQKGEV